MTKVRRTKYTPERVKTITDALADGLPHWVASARGGISHDTFCLWQNVHSEFADAVKVAESAFVAKNVKIIQKAAIKSWQAAAWLLERRWRDDFSKQLDISIAHERILADTRQLATERGLDPVAAVAEVETILSGR